MEVSFPKGTIYILVIDTNSYSGNFERQLAGYCTGVWDRERAHGDAEAADAKKANPSLVAVIEAKSTTVQHNEYGQVSNTIRATPGRLNNGAGYHYDAGDDPKIAREKSKQFMREYHAGQIKMCEDRLTNRDFETGRPGSWTKEACERTLESARQSIKNAGNFVGFPAYESVAMFFHTPLSDEEMDFVKQRAYEYAAKPFNSQSWGPKPFSIRDIYMVSVRGGDEVRL